MSTIKSPVWKVEGFRSLGSDGSVETLATSFGATEAQARATFNRLFNNPVHSTTGEKTPWTESELKFTRVGSGVAEQGRLL